MTDGRSREELTTGVFVELVETLVSDFDVIDLLTLLSSRSVELLDASAAGILLTDGNGHLRVMAASTEEVELLEVLQVQNDEGPCFDCASNGRPVVAPDLARELRWPVFAAASVLAGYPSVCAVPLRLGARVLGALNLFMTTQRALSDADLALAQALADVASIAMVQDEASRAAALRESRLQHALDSRILIEQAKGMIAQHSGADMDVAFQHLRNHSRRHNRRISDVARELVSGRMSLAGVVEA